MNLNVNVTEKLSAAMNAALAQIEGAGRTQISQAMGSEVRALIVKHLTDLAASRHTTADRLGATPTGFISNLAENFDQSSTVAADETGVSITMRHPVILRAVRDVTILPKKEFLAIPLNAIAYGRRPLEFGKGEVQFVRGRGTEIRQDLAAFLLVRRVTQKRDPSLLPTLDEINTAAATGARREIKAVLQAAQRL